MSFRELRSFTEIMRALGYPRLISLENFRTPNFELVADCLYWLVQRYHPGVAISDEISTEQDRVNFLQAIAQLMLTKARMKLNIKKLYAADGLAVKELLKLASLLYKATQKASTKDEEESAEGFDPGATLKGFAPRDVKQYASEIVKAGAALYDLLVQEPELREYRTRAAAAHMDTEYVERSVQEGIAQIEEHVRAISGQLEDLDKAERALDAKIEKRKAELERSEKRLATLQAVRPAYMDEYERLQGELNSMYATYLDRFRNLEYLENELEAYYAVERERMQANEKRLKRMQKRLVEQELRILRGEVDVDEAAILNGGDTDDDEEEDEEEEAQRGNGLGAAGQPGGGGYGLAAEEMPGMVGGEVRGALDNFGSDDDDDDEFRDYGEQPAAGGGKWQQPAAVGGSSRRGVDEDLGIAEDTGGGGSDDDF